MSAQSRATADVVVESLLCRYACDGVVVRGLKITADPVHGHNTDGVDPDSCTDVLVVSALPTDCD